MSVITTIDLNCDMGELSDTALEASLMPLITSANVACGGHAGDEASMRRTVGLARQHGVAVGAHPGYPDPANFGRQEMLLSPQEIATSVADQIRRLAMVAGELTHVKPHGALYNVAAGNPEVAGAIAEGVARCSRELVLVGLAGSTMLDVWRRLGFTVAAEAFADRRYEADGTLRPRRFADALITDPSLAAEQALQLAGRAQTICVHSDTPGAVGILTAVVDRFRIAGITPKSLSASPGRPCS